MNKNNTKQTKEAFKALGIDSPEALENEIQLQLKYLVEEGFAIELPNGKFRMKTKEELQEEVEEISMWVNHQQFDKLWTEREAFRKLCEDLQKELERLRQENENLRNVVAAGGLKSFGN